MSDSARLPKHGTEEYKALGQKLAQAAEQGDLATLQQAGAAMVGRLHGSGLLKCALQQAHIVAWLVEESERTGVDIASGWKPVHLAAYQGRLDKLKAASDEELSLTTVNGETVLHAAVIGDQGDAIDVLVRERGVDVHEFVVDKADVLDEDLVIYDGSASAAVARVHDGEPSKALVTAAKYGHVAAMEKLVQLGADITSVGGTGSFLHVVAGFGNVEVIDAAVRLGADPRAVDSHGRTALHEAAFEAQHGAMRRLAQLGVPVDGADLFGRTALHAASRSPEACRTLLELGADRWVSENTGRIARDLAARAEFSHDLDALKVVELLDTYFPVVLSMAQLLVGLKGPSESPLTRFAAHSLFEPKVLSLINCLLTGKEDKAYEQLAEECTGISSSAAEHVPFIRFRPLSLAARQAERQG